MGELRASVDGCEVVVKLEEGTELSDELRDALSDLAEAMYAERLEAAEVAEVEGFALKVGDMGLGLDSAGPVSKESWSCWGYTAVGNHCSWHSQDGGPDPASCTIYSKSKKLS